MPKKVKKKKGKKKGKGGGGGGVAAPSIAAAVTGTTFTTGDFVEEGAEVPAGLLYNEAPHDEGGGGEGGELVVDHSVIKKWVLEVAARKKKTTRAEIASYFHGRVDAGLFVRFFFFS